MIAEQWKNKIISLRRKQSVEKFILDAHVNKRLNEN